MEAMVKITAAEVNKLRQATGAGMMDCKKALVEAEGDFDKAIAVLRKKGQKVAEKRADRENSEGAAISKINADNTVGVAIVLGCETDFVGKNESFIALASEFADKAIGFNTKEDFLASDFGGMTVAEKLVEQTGVIGEKLDITGSIKIVDGTQGIGKVLTSDANGKASWAAVPSSSFFKVSSSDANHIIYSFIINLICI